MSEPLTDEDLKMFEQDALKRKAEKEPRGYGPAMQVVRLVAEVRRLRSDEWLERAAEDIYSNATSHLDGPAEVLALLKKYRDAACEHW